MDASERESNERGLPDESIGRTARWIASTVLATLLVALGWVGSVLTPASVAHAAPYCLMSKPQFGRPPQCREFYLADAVRTDAGALAVVVGGVCVATPIATRQSWVPDLRFPGPHADQRIGDLAMHAASPYHQDAYGCNAAMSGGAPGPSPLGGPGRAGGGASAASQCAAPGYGCRLQQVIDQPASRDASGRTIVEAALIHVLACPNSGTTYVYQYLNRQGFRVVHPPNWSTAIGGRDFANCEQAQAVAAGFSTAGREPASGATGNRTDAAVLVFVLKDIGLVAATQETVRTRPVCHWSGGGPRPCSASATVIGTLGGPYANEAAARADMRTKLDCKRGHWGTFIDYGSGRAWLQNNISGSECRSMKQL